MFTRLQTELLFKLYLDTRDMPEFKNKGCGLFPTVDAERFEDIWWAFEVAILGLKNGK